MTHRFVAHCLLLLGLGSWIAACGSTVGSSSVYTDAGDATAKERDHDSSTLKSPDATQKLVQRDSGTTQTCKPTTCKALGVSCGPQGDGCGGVLQCGDCLPPETCGGGGVANTCGAPNPDAGDGSTSIPTGPLTIAPLNDVITVPYGTQAPTVTYTAKVGGQSVAASFSIDLGQVGSINASTGVVTPSGLIGGVAHVTASFGTQTVSTPLTVTVQLTANGAPPVADAGGGNAGGNGGVGGSPAGGPVAAATQTILQGTPTADASLSWLYPYNNTVWPQGILAPLLQWTTTKTYDSVYIQLKEQGFSYQGFFATPTAGQPFLNVPIQQSVWDTLVYSNSGDPVTVTLAFSAGGVAYGPLTETWIIAPGTLTGTVYYNSYGTALAVNYPGSNGYPNFGAATLAIKHGATSPVLIAGKAGLTGNNSNCRVCHSVAAGGGTLVTEHGEDDNQSSSYALGATPATETVMPPAGGGSTVATYAFPAIYPDGSLLLSNTGPLPGIAPPSTSGLFSVPAGAAIASSGLPAGFSAATPSFSPDGTFVAFNQYGVDKVSLAAMAFANGTKTFSGLVKLTTPPAGTTDLFPAFLPTNDAVIYEHEVASDGEFGATRNGTRAELWWVDLATQTAAPLATLNGLIGGASYLPNYGTNHATDQTLQYEPTVNPVPSGGYAWVVFTSRRLYGNVATQDPFLSDPRDYNASIGITTKKLWVAAIDLNAPPGTDPSHPAFYLPAQELHACNSRGYWVVDPCEASGASCLTGDQCCSGYCGPAEGGYVCGTQPAGCAVLGNKCTVNSDCCGSTTGISCIDGFCAEPTETHDAASCAPTSCAKLGFNCGPAGNGCGGLLECGTCVSPATCGGAGMAGVCGTPKGPN